MKILAIGDFHGEFPAKLSKKLKKEEFDLIIGIGDYTGIKEWRSYILEYFRLIKKGKQAPSAEEYFGKKRFSALLKKDTKAAKKVLLTLDELEKPCFYIFGNGDDEWYNYPFDIKQLKPKKSKRNFLKRLKNMKEINYGFGNYKGISFIGFGGYMDVLSNYDLRKTEELEKYKRALKRLKTSRKKFLNILKKTKKERIFVLHYPPKGIFDIIREKGNPYSGKSAGISFFTEAIIKYKPRLVFCGHMHEYQGVKKLGKTLVVNPGEAARGRAAIIDYPEDKKSKIKVRFIR